MRHCAYLHPPMRHSKYFVIQILLLCLDTSAQLLLGFFGGAVCPLEILDQLLIGPLDTFCCPVYQTLLHLLPHPWFPLLDLRLHLLLLQLLSRASDQLPTHPLSFSQVQMDLGDVVIEQALWWLR